MQVDLDAVATLNSLRLSPAFSDAFLPILHEPPLIGRRTFPWWLAQVCLRADHIRCRFAKLAQLIVCHLLKTLAKLVDIERRQLNFLLSCITLGLCGTWGKRCRGQ